MKLILASTYAGQDETSGDIAELAKFREPTPEKGTQGYHWLGFQ